MNPNPNPAAQKIHRATTEDLLAGLSSSPLSRTVVPLEAPPRPDGSEAEDATQTEKGWHRMVCVLTSQGMTPGEIADRLHKSVGWVRRVLKSPRARKMIARLIEESGLDGIDTLLQAGTVDAVMTMRELAMDAKSEAVRQRSAADILNRVLGPAKDGLRSAVSSPEEDLREIEEIKKQQVENDDG